MARGKVLPARSKKGSRSRVQRRPPAGQWPGRHALVVVSRSRGAPKWWDICSPPLNSTPGHVFRNAAPRTPRLLSGPRIKIKPPSRFTGWRSGHGQTYVGGSLAGAGSSAVYRREEGPLGNSGYAPSSECACNERYHEKDEENDEQELCDARSGAGDAAEAKQSSDDRQYEKCQCPTEHVCLHFLCPTIQAVYEATTPVIR